MYKRTFTFCIIILLISLLSLSAFSLQVPDDGRFTEVRENVINAVKKGDVPSLSIAVAKGGKIVWEEAFGWANRETRINATPHTMYSLASISKPITATGLMILVEQGKIDLKKPINDYLGDAKLTAYEGTAADATVKRVLNHAAGLPLHYNFFFEDEPYPRPPTDETIRRYGIILPPPGEIYNYSNLGFGLINYIISRISGKSFTQFMKDEVFIPLNLMHTSVDIGPGLGDYAAEKYDGNNKPIPFYKFDHPGASALYSSAHDLVKFGMFHLKNHLSDHYAILKDETIDLMHRENDPDAPNYQKYGLGWGLNNDDNGYRSVSHTGGMPGVNTILKLIPSENIAVVVLCNKGGPLPFVTANQIFSVLLPDFAENLKNRHSRSRG